MRIVKDCIFSNDMWKPLWPLAAILLFRWLWFWTYEGKNHGDFGAKNEMKYKQYIQQ